MVDGGFVSGMEIGVDERYWVARVKRARSRFGDRQTYHSMRIGLASATGRRIIRCVLVSLRRPADSPYDESEESQPILAAQGPDLSMPLLDDDSGAGPSTSGAASSSGAAPGSRVEDNRLSGEAVLAESDSDTS
ncbi:unnamed protein product [Arctia plantaginis]|uniref:Uncharacterized protein n=1 Tax=Arctia plantaginis TaxID=874455 RepID=A0A8S1AQ06_ARCPL|nr:unnamed protein product [Arctia plantaginis]